MHHYSRIIPAFLLFSLSVFADFRYQQVTRTLPATTGPVTSTVMLKGNRMATLSADGASIVDLDKETFTNIDMVKKTYTVTTFAEMKAMVSAVKAPGIDLRADVKQTGQKRDISGFPADQFLVSLTGPASMQMDVWTTSAKVDGYDELREFSRRMAAKIDWTPGTQAAPGMAELVKQMQKLEGVPLLQVMRIGTGVPAHAAQAAALPAAASQQQQQQPSGPGAEAAVYEGATRAMTTGALGSNAMRAGMVAGSLSGLTGFGRKKKQQQQQAPAPAAPPAAAPAHETASAQMEITTEMKGFSTAAVDDATFDIPAGFEQAKKK